MAQEAAAKTPFEQAVEFVRALPKDGDVQLDQETRLKFYGWFKQATVGKCSEKGGAQPWKVQMEARAKWDAWNAVAELSVEDAKKAYVDLLTEKTKGTNQEFAPQ
eukprot:63600_1